VLLRKSLEVAVRNGSRDFNQSGGNEHYEVLDPYLASPRRQRGGVVAASSKISSEVVGGRRGYTLLPSLSGAAPHRGRRFRLGRIGSGVHVRLSEEELGAFCAGIQNRQGVIEVSLPDAPGAISQLKRYLDQSGGKPFQLGRDQNVFIHSLSSYASQYGGMKFSAYVALVSQEEGMASGYRNVHTFRVPLTEITADPSMEPDDVQYWQHPAFEVHLEWLLREYGDISHIQHRPIFMRPKSLSMQTEHGAFLAHVLDDAFFVSRSEMVRALRGVHQPTLMLAGLDGEIYLPRKNSSLWSRLSGVFKKKGLKNARG
jgi:hypothetical protein